MTSPFLPGSIYKFLFALLGLVYVSGLFVPLMDNDSAHHANIALHMHLTGDYASLVDHNGDYLDKPHLLFWLAAFSYKVFGVTGFAYKLPSLLFTILGIYSTYRLGASLYNKEVGKLSALLIASAFAFILANNDVRMDALLTACIAFASWQLVDFIQTKRWINVAGAALGLALGFSTKGMIGVFVPAIGSLFYILYGRDHKILLNGKWLVMLLLFAVFISPVLYSYYLQFNLHPEKVIRGKNEINGVKFILLNQSVERFGGQTGDTSKQDHFFFLHSFLWAFAPWSVLVYLAVVKRFRNYLRRELEWFTVSTFVVMLLLVSFAGFKLPHYLNIIFPVASIIAAAFIISSSTVTKWVRGLFILQLCISVLLLLAGAVINGWAFPIMAVWKIALLVILLAVVFYFMKSGYYNRSQKTVLIPVSAMAVLFFLLNNNFYPQLLKYQGGNELAFATREKVDRSQVYFWGNTQSSSFNFYSASWRKPFHDSILKKTEPTWLLYDIRDEHSILQQYELGKRFENLDYEITKIDIKFMNPQKRNAQCSKMVLAEIIRK